MSYYVDEYEENCFKEVMINEKTGTEFDEKG